MPVAYIDLLSGLKLDAKKKLVTEVAASIHHAYMIPDTRVFLREWSAEQISVDGGQTITVAQLVFDEVQSSEAGQGGGLRVWIWI